VKDAKKTDADQSTKLKRLAKFEESGWKMIAYGTIAAVSGYALHDKTFWRNTRDMWTNCYELPCMAPTPPEMRLAYAFDMAYYSYAIPYALLYETKRKDMAATIVHHFITVALIGYSYAMGFTRVGVVIMFIHDICDVPLEIAKMAQYADAELVTNVVFAGFSVLWIYMRNYVYPFIVVRSVLWEAHDLLVTQRGLPPWPHYQLFATMLIALGLLQVYWTVIILRILNKAIFGKQIISDSRDIDDGVEAD